MTPQEVLINTALSQVGYDAAAGKYNKYAAVLDKLGFVYNGPKNGFDWCDVFVDWCFISTFGADIGIEMLYQPKHGTGAGCPFSADFFRDHNAFYQDPEPGDQIFFGPSGDEYHTGIVIDVTDHTVYTVEGNTGGGSGHVMKKNYPLGGDMISGYGRPKWSLAKQETDNMKTVDQLAREVIAGKWDYGSKRYEKLRAAGYDPEKVQAKVNAIVRAELNVRLARDVIAGKWGNGSARKKALEKAGYNYEEIQAIVNRLLLG